MFRTTGKHRRRGRDDSDGKKLPIHEEQTFDIGETILAVLPILPDTDIDDLANMLWESDNAPLNAFVYLGPASVVSAAYALGSPFAVITASHHHDLTIWVRGPNGGAGGDLGQR